MTTTDINNIRIMRPRAVTAAAVASVALLLMLLTAACSTTRRIADDEQLYTGKKVTFVGNTVTTEAGKTKTVNPLPADVQDAIIEAVDVEPNNYWSLLGCRSPLPIGLWVYNNWSNPPSGLKHWIYEHLVEEPVLVSDVRPDLRTHMIEEILDNNGFFRGTGSYTLTSSKDPKKAKITYTVTPGPLYPVSGVEMLPDTCALNHAIDSVAAMDPYLSRPGQRYCTDSLTAARTRIANALRNKGYYFFQPSYIEYLADSVMQRGSVALRMKLAANIPAMARNRYVTGAVTVTVARNEGGGVPDTMALRRLTLIQMRPSRLRSKSIEENVTFRPGRTFSVRDMNRTQTYLSRLGIFRSIDISARPDTTCATPTLNVAIDCTFDAPLEASIEVNVKSKSNSYIGPGLSLGLTNRNLFGGGEQLSVNLTGAYEWQTGKGSERSLFNSYEVGLSGSLDVPRLLAPKFIPRGRYQLNWTRFQLGADLLNRPHFFKMAQFDAAVSYDWRLRRYVSNSFTPFKLTYTKLINTTAEFDDIMAENPAVAQSFQSQFIPQMSYTYTYDRNFDNRNTLNWTFTISEAGNIFWGIYQACGAKGEKKLFGTPFSQFVKATAQLVWGHRVLGNHWLVMRAAAGVAHAYGNSQQVPYAEQFYVGGANSVRAFTVRSIGPGRYRSPDIAGTSYFDQTGTLKFEANVEYRFPLFGPLHGALFVDAGNVWLLKSDPARPGAEVVASKFLRDLALGTGCGLRLDISMLVLRADLGIGIHAPYNTGHGGYYNMESFGKSLAFHLAIGYPF